MTIKHGLGEPVITKYQRLMESLPMVVNLGELDFAYLRPQRAGRVEMRHRHSGMWWAAPYEVVGHHTRAQAALAANKPRSYADTVDRISPEERVF